MMGSHATGTAAASVAAEADDEDEDEDEANDGVGPIVSSGGWRDSGVGTSLDDGMEVVRRQRRRKGFSSPGAGEELRR